MPIEEEEEEEEEEGGNGPCTEYFSLSLLDVTVYRARGFCGGNACLESQVRYNSIIKRSILKLKYGLKQIKKTLVQNQSYIYTHKSELNVKTLPLQFGVSWT